MFKSLENVLESKSIIVFFFNTQYLSVTLNFFQGSSAGTPRSSVPCVTSVISIRELVFPGRTHQVIGVCRLYVWCGKN